MVLFILIEVSFEICTEGGMKLYDVNDDGDKDEYDVLGCLLENFILLL